MQALLVDARAAASLGFVHADDRKLGRASVGLSPLLMELSRQQLQALFAGCLAMRFVFVDHAGVAVSGDGGPPYLVSDSSVSADESKVGSS